uniref:Uncharacterized protein n=1 Tax=Romanomermis culicivorax TaxID=13658 RepID=A0A915KJK7_ROMCU
MVFLWYNVENACHILLSTKKYSLMKKDMFNYRTTNMTTMLILEHVINQTSPKAWAHLAMVCGHSPIGL